MPLLRPRLSREQKDSGAVCLRQVRTRSERRSSRRAQCLSGRTCRDCLWRDGVVGPPVEAGTRRSDSGSRSLSAVGILGLQAREDVNCILFCPFLRWFSRMADGSYSATTVDCRRHQGDDPALVATTKDPGDLFETGWASLLSAVVDNRVRGDHLIHGMLTCANDKIDDDRLQRALTAKLQTRTDTSGPCVCRHRN